MRSAIALALIFELFPFDLAAGSDIKAQVQQLQPDTTVQVTLKNKEALRGLLGPVSEQGFVLKVAASGKDENQQIAFQDVKSIKRLDRKSHLGRNLTIIVVAVVAAAAIVYVVALKSTLNKLG